MASTEFSARRQKLKDEMAQIDLEEKAEKARIRKQEQEEENRKREQHKNDLAVEYGLVGHPKLDKVYELAWEEGHSSGWSEIGYWFGALSNLVRD